MDRLAEITARKDANMDMDWADERDVYWLISEVEKLRVELREAIEIIDVYHRLTEGHGVTKAELWLTRARKVVGDASSRQ